MPTNMKNNKIIKARIASRERKKQAEQWKKQKKNGERERQRKLWKNR